MTLNPKANIIPFRGAGQARAVLFPGGGFRLLYNLNIGGRPIRDCPCNSGLILKGCDTAEDLPLRNRGFLFRDTMYLSLVKRKINLVYNPWFLLRPIPVCTRVEGLGQG